jgi:hypothetical protein
MPATVSIVPVALSTRRMRWLSVSAKNTLPASTATPFGKFARARSARSPSPLQANSPLPATVSITPLASTQRMRWNSSSAMKICPAPSTATPLM